MSFRKWLSQQTDRNDPVGDLARDARRSGDAPNRDRLSTWRTYLVNKNACHEAQAALMEAWGEYRAEVTK